MALIWDDPKKKKIKKVAFYGDPEFMPQNGQLSKDWDKGIAEGGYHKDIPLGDIPSIAKWIMGGGLQLDHDVDYETAFSKAHETFDLSVGTNGGELFMGNKGEMVSMGKVSNVTLTPSPEKIDWMAQGYNSFNSYLIDHPEVFGSSTLNSPIQAQTADLKFHKALEAIDNGADPHMAFAHMVGGSTETESPAPVQIYHTPPHTEEMAMTQEYLLLHKKYEELEGKKIVERMEELKKKLQLIANEDEESCAAVQFDCPEGTLTFSPRAKVKEIKDLSVLLDHVNDNFGEEALLSLITVGMTKLQKLMSEAELKPFINLKEGSRSLVAVKHKDE